MKRLIVFTILLMNAFWAFAQDVSFRASAPRVVEVGEQFRLTFSLNKKGSGIELGDTKDFQLLMGPSTSSSISTQIINGNVSTQKNYSFSYVFMANKAGKYTLPVANVRVDGKTIASNSIIIEVVKARNNATSAKSSDSRGQTSNKISAENLFVKVELNRKSLYMGEFVIASLKLYSRVSVSNLGRSKIPSFKGFLSQEIKMTDQISLNRENINGVIYNVGVLRKLVLFPQHSGKISIDPFELDVYVRQKAGSRGGFFDDFFANYKEVKITRRSKVVKINVKQLPLAGRPSSFNGTVGHMKLKSSISRDSVMANDAVTLKVVVSGNGNLKLIEPLDMNFPADFEIYDPKINKNINSKSNGTSGSVTFEYVFIPRSAGEYTIPSSKFSYFDPKTRKYKTLNTKAFVIHVKKGKNIASQGNVVTSFTKEDVKFIGKDIRFIKVNSNKLYSKGVFLFGSLKFYLSYLSALLAFILLIVFNKRRIKNNADVVRVKNRRATKVANKRLKKAEESMKSREKESFYDEILKALWGYTSDKLNIPLSDLSKDNIADVLSKRGVDDLILAEYLDVINTCEFARYAPVANENELGDVYSKTTNIILKLEKTIK